MSLATIIISTEHQSIRIGVNTKNSSTHLLSVKQAESIVAKRENFTISSLFKEPSPKNVPKKKEII